MIVISPEDCRRGREVCDLTQQEMADALGVSRRTITYWERDGVPHSPAAIVYAAIRDGRTILEHLTGVPGVAAWAP